MGRELLRRRVVVTPTACKFWSLGNVRHSWLNAYWKWLWAMQIPRKTMVVGTLWHPCEVMDEGVLP